MGKATSFFAILVLFLLISTAAFAIPELTFDFEDGAAEFIEPDGWFITASDFDLFANVNTDDVLRGNSQINLYLCISLSGDLYTMDGEGNITYTGGTGITANGQPLTFEYGTPPISDLNEDGNGGDLAPHGYFPTAFAEYVIPITGAGTYTVSIANAVPGVHFDLYTLDELDRIDFFSPFSHDAEVVTPPVPEPATLTLLGSGLLLLPAGVYFRKKSSRKKDSGSEA
jgi:hypothetical protein